MTASSCPVHRATEKAPPLFQNGTLTFQAHHVGWLLCAIFAIISTTASAWLIGKHVSHYTNPGCQRYIVRLLFMVPVYSIVTLLAYIFYSDASPFLIIRDGYEGVVLSAFFYLMLQYLSPSPAEQKNVFRRKACFDHTWHWIFPFGFVNAKPPDGLYFLQMMKWGVLQYCVIRPCGALISVILEAVNVYCEMSWNPRWAHVWIVTIVSISVSVAMYCLIQLYVVVAPELATHKPLLQLLAVKAVVFLTFWQTAVLGALSTFGVIKDQKYMTAEDINVGIAALLQNFEMIIFAFLHIRAFSYKPYVSSPTTTLKPSLSSEPTPSSPKSMQTHRLSALVHAFTFTETWDEIRAGLVYMYRWHIRRVEAEPESRMYHFEAVMGTERRLPSPAALSTQNHLYFGTEPDWLRHMKGQDRAAMRPHGQQVSWEPALEPLYPHAEHDTENAHHSNLDSPPPPSILREHLGAPTSLEWTKSLHAQSHLSHPSPLIMPKPLSPARFPVIEYTDSRLLRS